MLYEVYKYHEIDNKRIYSRDGENEAPLEMFLGTIEDTYLGELAKYLVEACDFIEMEPKKNSALTLAIIMAIIFASVLLDQQPKEYHHPGTAST